MHMDLTLLEFSFLNEPFASVLKFATTSYDLGLWRFAYLQEPSRTNCLWDPSSRIEQTGVKDSLGPFIHDWTDTEKGADVDSPGDFCPAVL
jgi:hypothetical protein